MPSAPEPPRTWDRRRARRRWRTSTVHLAPTTHAAPSTNSPSRRLRLRHASDRTSAGVTTSGGHDREFTAFQCNRHREHMYEGTMTTRCRLIATALPVVFAMALALAPRLLHGA